MSNRQRLTYLAIAAVIAVVAVVVLAFGGGDDDEAEVSGTTSAQTTTATTATTESTAQETATPTATATPKPQPPLLQAGEERELSFKSGDTVRFRVRSEKADEVHVHGYDIEREIGAGETITISFKATLEGIFDVEFHSTDEKIGSLKVEP